MEHTSVSKTEPRTYVDGGINWNWYLQGLFNDAEKTVTILFVNRWHKYDDDCHPQVDHPRADYEVLREGEEIYGVVRIHSHDGPSTDYKVLNPKTQSHHYRDYSMVVMERSR